MNQSHSNVEFVSTTTVVHRRPIQRACHSGQAVSAFTSRRTGILQDAYGTLHSSSRKLLEITSQQTPPVLFDFLFLEYSTSKDAFNVLVPTPCSSVAEAEWFRPTIASTMFALSPNITHKELVANSRLIEGLRSSIQPYHNFTQPLSIVLTHESVSENPDAALVGVEQLKQQPQQLVSEVVSSANLTFITCFYKNQSEIIPIGSISLLPSKDLTEAEKGRHSESFHGAKVEKGTLPEYPNDGLTLVGSSWMSQAEWVRRFLSNNFWQRLLNIDFRAPFQIWKPKPANSTDTNIPGVFPLLSDNDNVTIGIASDWAAGTFESDLVQAAMMGTRTLAEMRDSDQVQSNTALFDTSYSIHLGDCYYVGSKQEIEKSMLGKPVAGESVRGVVWPSGSKGTLSLPGNHELYSGATPYYQTLLPTMWINDKQTQQQASFFALTHSDWIIIGLDTGYDSFKSRPNITSNGIITDNQDINLPAPLVSWLQSLKLNESPNSNKGIIFLSHHQVASAFEKESGTTLFQKRVSELLDDSDRRIVWLYGHEHRFSVYHFQQPVKVGQQTVPLAVYHRCIGNSGFPCEVALLPSCPRKTGLQYYDDRIYQVEVDGNVSVPIGFNGFTRMHIVRDNSSDGAGSKLVIEYYTIRLENNELVSRDPVLLLRETFSNHQGSVVLESQTDVLPELTEVVIT